MRLPLTVRQVHSTSSFWGLSLHTILPYVHTLSGGMSACAIKVMVLVPSMRLPTPWALRLHQCLQKRSLLRDLRDYEKQVYEASQALEREIVRSLPVH